MKSEQAANTEREMSLTHASVKLPRMNYDISPRMSNHWRSVCRDDSRVHKMYNANNSEIEMAISVQSDRYIYYKLRSN